MLQLAMEMKQSGMYVSRGLSFQGADFNSMAVALTARQQAAYDAAALWWKELLDAIGEAESLGANVANARKAYWGDHQRFFKSMCISVKVPDVAERALEALAQGHCVVIGLQGTGEAGIAKMLQRDGAGKVYPQCPSTAREIARQFVEGKSFPCELAEAKDELPQPEPPSDAQLQQLAAAYRAQGLFFDLDAELASAHRQRAQNAARQEREREALLRGAEPPPSDPVLDPGLAALRALRERLLASLLGIEGLPESPLDNLIDRLGGAAKVSAVRVRCSVVRPARGRGEG